MVLATNVQARMAAQYAALPHETNMVHRLAKDSGVGHGTIERILNSAVDTQLDKIARIAHAFHTTPAALLTPPADMANLPQPTQREVSTPLHRRSS
jgi:transcriptional regulator with XRE-family HTH domain